VRRFAVQHTLGVGWGLWAGIGRGLAGLAAVEGGTNAQGLWLVAEKGGRMVGWLWRGMEVTTVDCSKRALQHTRHARAPVSDRR